MSVKFLPNHMPWHCTSCLWAAMLKESHVITHDSSRFYLLHGIYWEECSGVFCDISIPVSCPVCLPDYMLCCLDSVAVVESFPPADGPPATHTLNEVRTWFLTISQLADASVCYGLISLPSSGWLCFLILLELPHLTTFIYFIMLI